MIAGRPRLAWRTRDPQALAARLGPLVFGGRGTAVAVRTPLEIVHGQDEALVLTAGPGAPEPGLPGTHVDVEVLALGWATVELERWGALARLPDDELLGAVAAVARPVRRRPAVAQAAVARPADGASAGDPLPGRGDLPWPVLLLEPATEGPLAAALARHGEGPIALYVAIPGPPPTAGSRPGPFGPEWLIAGPPRGPFLIACEAVLTEGHPARTIGG